MNINHNHILSLLQTGFTTIAVTFDYNADTDPVLRVRNRSTRVKEYRHQSAPHHRSGVGSQGTSLENGEG